MHWRPFRYHGWAGFRAFAPRAAKPGLPESGAKDRVSGGLRLGSAVLSRWRPWGCNWPLVTQGLLGATSRPACEPPSLTKTSEVGNHDSVAADSAEGLWKLPGTWGCF